MTHINPFALYSEPVTDAIRAAGNIWLHPIMLFFPPAWPAVAVTATATFSACAHQMWELSQLKPPQAKG